MRNFLKERFSFVVTFSIAFFFSLLFFTSFAGPSYAQWCNPSCGGYCGGISCPAPGVPGCPSGTRTNAWSDGLGHCAGTTICCLADRCQWHSGQCTDARFGCNSGFTYGNNSSFDSVCEGDTNNQWSICCLPTSSGGGNSCGNGVCDNGETCSTCPGDCGSCGGGTSCPLFGDAKTYSTNGHCDSSTGLGFNTRGGSFSCGPVACPGDNSGTYPTGNTCIYTSNGHCDAGYGGGGYNPSSSEGGCSFAQLNVTCPSQNQTVTIQVKDPNGNGVSGIALTVYDNGHGNYTITTNGSGTASFNSWSGDHFQVWPQANANYTFNINQQSNPIDGVVNTSWSCGTTLGWPSPSGNPNSPCQITATPATYSVSGSVYIDYNHNKVKDTLDSAYTAGNIQVTDGTNTATVQTDGTFTLPKVPNGTQTISIVASSLTNYATVIASQQVTGPPAVTGVVLSITPLYSISGTVFFDYDQSHCYNPSTKSCTYQGKTFAAGNDTGFQDPSGTQPNITMSQQGGAAIQVKANATTGIFTSGTTLTSGTYSVIYNTGFTPLPPGYRFTTNNGWTVVLGDPTGSPDCSPGGSSDATCGNPNNGSLSNLNFGLTNETAWGQSICSDVRDDGGYSNTIPSTANCGGTSAPYAIIGNATCPTNPTGVLYTGNATPNYGQGTGASTSNMVIGGTIFPEVFTPKLQTALDSSFGFVSTTINNLSSTPIPLTSICPNLTTCTISSLTPGGVYTTTAADGPVSITVTGGVLIPGLSGTLGATNYTFLIGGDLTLNSKILLQSTHTAAFIADGNIHVAGTIGESNWNSVNPDLEGFYSAGKSFYIDSQNTAGNQCNADGSPKELKLNIKGSVIVDANKQGGSIVNNRDGCGQDLSCPTYTISIDPLQLLHAPGPLKPPYSFWQELNP